MPTYTLNANGQTYEAEVLEDTPLLWVLRDNLGLTGTKYSCGIGQCGSCTVLLDGEPTRSCVLPVSGVGERAITTIEGLSEDGSHPVQKAWLDAHVTQCGYCQPGQILNAAALLEKTPNPSDEDIDAAMKLDVRRDLYFGRNLDVIKLAAEKAGWGEALPNGWGRGMAFHATFGVTHVAMVADVEVSGGEVQVHRVVVAVDCGPVINPDNVAAQMESGIVFGLTAALKAQVTLENGRVQQSNFHDCPVLTFDEMPLVETYFIEGSTQPNGIGEMGVPPVAPAIANAVYAATGKRVRHIPIMAEDL